MPFIYFITAGGKTYVGQDKNNVGDTNSRIIQHCKIAYGEPGSFLGSEELIRDNGLFQTKITYDASLSQFDTQFEQFKTLWSCTNEEQSHLDFYEIVYTYRCPNEVVNRDAGGQATYTCNIETLFKYWELQKVPNLEDLKAFITTGLSEFAKARQSELPAGQVVTWSSKFQDKTAIRNLFNPETMVFGYAVMGSIHITPTIDTVMEIVKTGLTGLTTKTAQTEALMATIKEEYTARANAKLKDLQSKWGSILSIPSAFSEFQLSKSAYENLAKEWLNVLNAKNSSKTFTLSGAKFAVAKIRPKVEETKEPHWMPVAAATSGTEFDTRPWAMSLFRQRFEKAQGSDNISETMRLMYPEIIQQNWEKFYTEQMCLMREATYGPLVRINEEDETGLVKVGRQNLHSDENRIHLFTVPETEWTQLEMYDKSTMTIW